MMYEILICALFAVWVLGFIAIMAFIKYEEWEDNGRWAEILLLFAWPALIFIGMCQGFGQLVKKYLASSRRWVSEQGVRIRDKIKSSRSK